MIPVTVLLSHSALRWWGCGQGSKTTFHSPWVSELIKMFAPCAKVLGVMLSGGADFAGPHAGGACLHLREGREPRPGGRRSTRVEACPAQEPQTSPGTVVPAPSPGHKENGLRSSPYSRAASLASSGAALNRPFHSVQAQACASLSCKTWGIVTAH